MEIKFEKIDSVYVAEFEITSNCNIHIEREDLGRFIIESRGSKSGKYVPMEEGHYGDKYVIDVDMLGNIYPKYIKITSVSKPTYAEVNFAEQGGGGNSGGIDPNDPESEYFTEYFNTSDLPQGFETNLNVFAFLSKYGSNITIGKDASTNVEAVAIMPNLPITMGGVTISLKEVAIKEGLIDLYNSVPRITKEEFYNLEA